MDELRCCSEGNGDEHANAGGIYSIRAPRQTPCIQGHGVIEDDRELFAERRCTAWNILGTRECACTPS